MFKPKEDVSNTNRGKIKAMFASCVPDSAAYTVAYSTVAKTGIFSTKIINYVVGFSKERRELVIIPIDDEVTEHGEPISLTPDNVASAKKNLQGQWVIKSNAADKLLLSVPGYTVSMGEAMYTLPLIQEEEAAAFIKFMQETF
ncbi:MAG: hypothetical protein LBF92_01330 [Synergistaceae bacterium]|jgi:hypothetical protein|nr:hypothetical protein [Synergistaceae bacterium]